MFQAKMPTTRASLPTHYLPTGPSNYEPAFPPNLSHRFSTQPRSDSWETQNV
jgi:hypothetical protein